MIRIAICKEKHGNCYYNVTTEERLHKVALYILKNRLEAGWYEFPVSPDSIDFTEADINTAPACAKKIMQENFQHYKRAILYYENIKTEWEDIHNAIKNNNGKLAYRILCDRNGYQYEGFEIEEIEDLD